MRDPRSSRVELLALDVYQRAQDNGQRITLPMVEQRLAQLRGHRPTCQCGRCGRVAKALPRKVFELAADWQRWARNHERVQVSRPG